MLPQRIQTHRVKHAAISHDVTRHRMMKSNMRTLSGAGSSCASGDLRLFSEALK
jgi:hypothetical protein